MQLLDSKPKQKKKNWVTGALGGTLLAALVLPLALTGASAALDGESFLIQAENTNDPEITSRSGMLLSDSDGGDDGGEIPIDPDGEIPPVVDPLAKMVSTWDTSIAGCANITLPIWRTSGVDVDWGDGVSESDLGSAGQPAHSYTDTLGEKTITVSGQFEAWGAGIYSPSKTCITRVTSWGETGTTDLSQAFSGASNLIEVKEVPTGVTNMSQMFIAAAKFNSPLNFETSSVVNMSQMLFGATAFNSPINFTDTSKVTNMNGMFSGAEAFDQPLNFDTSSVTDMGNMFGAASAFNSPINFTSTSKVTDMGAMFGSAEAFNQPLNFDTSSVTDMRNMFSSATAFNSPINFTDTSKVTTMNHMFYSAKSFNQPVNFDTSSVTDMGAMFRSDTTSVFNSPINFTDTSKVTTMGGMFSGAKKFNQPLNFNTSSVTTMTGMFQSAEKFNQPLNFDTSSVTDMRNMFIGAYAMLGDLSNWNVEKVTDWSGFGPISAAKMPKFK